MIFTAPIWGDNLLDASKSGYYRLNASQTLHHGAVMKLQKKLYLPKLEIDLSRIQQLSRKHEDENWEFRSWLKQYAPDDVDRIVKTLSQKYFALIDCTQCGNCCRSLHVEFKKNELHVIAKTLGLSIEAFQKQSMSEGKVNPPCPMLNGKLCSIYENRPDHWCPVKSRRESVG
jgi:hypothetical protein